MKYFCVKKVIWIFVVISGIFFGILFLVGYRFDTPNFVLFYIKKLPIAVTITLVFMWCIDKFIWKLKLLYPWFISIPDLNGCWEGTLESSYINPETGEKCPEINVTVKIKQTLNHQSCVMTSKEMKSDSFVTDFDIDRKNQKLDFIYSYESRPNQGEIRNRSPIHLGTTLFHIKMDNKRAVGLEGEYWTGRGTTGSITLTRK